VIHVDKDINIPEKTIEDVALQYFDLEMRAFMVRHNVFFISYHYVHWGGISIVQAELDVRYETFSIKFSIHTTLSRCYNLPYKPTGSPFSPLSSLPLIFVLTSL